MTGYTIVTKLCRRIKTSSFSASQPVSQGIGVSKFRCRAALISRKSISVSLFSRIVLPHIPHRATPLLGLQKDGAARFSSMLGFIVLAPSKEEAFSCAVLFRLRLWGSGFRRGLHRSLPHRPGRDGRRHDHRLVIRALRAIRSFRLLWSAFCRRYRFFRR